MISPFDQEGLERLAQVYYPGAYFAGTDDVVKGFRASEALDNLARVIYKAKDGRTTKTCLAIDWLAHLSTHMPKYWRADGQVLLLLFE
ncbi:MAG: hypothetical protein DDT29_01620 [Dehalococcoidia bacterium]|nr:hypothetical protein [Bacillota bacterium]